VRDARCGSAECKVSFGDADVIDPTRGQIRKNEIAVVISLCGRGLRTTECYLCVREWNSVRRYLPTYAEVGALLGLSEGGVKSAVSRMRTRYRELVRQAVAHTVADPGEIDEEIRYLISVISS